MDSDRCKICEGLASEPVQCEMMEIEIEPKTRHVNGHLQNHCYERPSRWSYIFHSEYGKTIIAFLYVRCVLYVVEFAMAYLQYHIPDRTKYTPLPDLFLDNIQIIPWGSKVSEVIIMFYTCVWIVILLFHKYRLVLIRRLASVLAIMYLTRIFTILMTGLPVPSVHKKCEIREDGSLQKYFSLWLVIVKSNGFQIQGLKTCGDYMFSGHTVALTMITCMVREYTPRRWLFFRIIVWISNFVGMFYILASHGHYSIDVFIAFVMSYRTFQYYHTLANARVLSSRDKDRRVVLFPFFYYFEDNFIGVVSNEYEWPLKNKSFKVLTKNSLETITNRFKRKASEH